MTTLFDYYNEDGTPWFSRAVLAYLQGHYKHILSPSWDEEKHEYKAKIGLTRYVNGREQGYTFSIMYDGWQKNYSVFCPCQWDGICLETFEQVSDFPYPWDLKEWSKHGPFQFEFTEDEVMKCAKFIYLNMNEELDKKIKEKWKQEKSYSE